MSEDDKGEWPRTGVYATFMVESVDETMDWYQRMLGWEVGKDAFDEQGNCTFGSVLYGYHAINFTRGGEKPSYVYRNVVMMIDVLDVDGLYEAIVGKGGKPSDKPKDEPWGGRTFTMKDPNGLPLMFVQLPDEKGNLPEDHREDRPRCE